MEHGKNENNTFSYTYSAAEQDEIQRIRKKYVPEETDNLERLIALDKSTTKKAAAVSITVGIIGSLILGIGMCMFMIWNYPIVGIAIGSFGIAAIASAYPLYTVIVKKERKKIAPEIIRLSDELTGRK